MSKKKLKTVIKDLDLLHRDLREMSKSKLEKKYGYKGHTIRMFLEREGYNTKTFLEYKKDRDTVNIIRLFDNGLLVQEISERIDSSIDYVYNILKDNNIDYNANNHCNKNNMARIPIYHMDEKYIPYYRDDRYAISNYGRVWSMINMRFLRHTVKTGKDKGYCRYKIAGKMKYKHRLVAIHFIPNPENLPEVNHIDHNRMNCKYNNLEWCDRSHNIKHSYKNKGNYERAKKRAKNAGMENAKKVKCIEDGNIFNSLADCARNYGIKYPEGVGRVCSGRNSYAKGEDGRRLHFIYEEESEK